MSKKQRLIARGRCAIVPLPALEVLGDLLLRITPLCVPCFYRVLSAGWDAGLRAGMGRTFLDLRMIKI